MVIGSINLDESLTMHRLPGQGETVVATGCLSSPGGKGGNQAVAAARAGGAATTLICCVGDDDASDQLRASLEAEGIDVLAGRHTGPSGRAIVMLGDAGENSIVVVPGANINLRTLPTPEAEASVARARIIVMQLETPADLIEVVGRIKHPQALLLLNAAPALPIADALWQWIDVLIVNEHEATSYTSLQDPAAAARALLARVPRVIVTLGSSGSLYCDRDGAVEHVDAVRVNPLDTTGAGDTYCGVLAANLSRAVGMREAMRAGSRAAALATLRRGAQRSIPTSDMILSTDLVTSASEPTPSRQRSENP
ncbi:ribokinase [Microbacterium luteolum]